MAETQNIAVNALPVEAPQKTDYLLGIGASEEFRATVEDFVEATDVVSDLANGMVGKNLLPNTARSTGNFTVNTDGTITVNGSFTSQTDLNVGTVSFDVDTKVTLNGAPSGGGTTTYALFISGKGTDSGSGVTFTLNAGTTYTVVLRLYAGYVADNLVIKPMIRKATIKDDTYVPYQRSISAVEEEISYHDASGYLGKNLCNPNLFSGSGNGGTITNNGDGTYTVNGTFTAQQTWNFTNPNMELPAGKYIVSGISGGSSSTYKMIVNKLRSSGSYQTIVNDLYTGDREIDLTSDYGGAIRVYIQCQSGYVASNLTFYPMVRPATIKDPTYVPYSLSNVDLTKNFADELTANQNSGFLRKNLVGVNINTLTNNGVVFTVNKNTDGTLANITLTGASTLSSTITQQITDFFTLPAGQYIVNGTPSNAAANTCRFRVRDRSNNALAYVHGSPATFTLTQPTDVAMQIQVAANYTLASSFVFYPMIRPATIEDGTYVPYAPSNVDLNEVDITSSVTNTDIFRFKVTKRGNRVFVYGQGENRSYSTNETLFTLPQEYRPSMQQMVPCTVNVAAYGILAINTDGTVVLNQLSTSPTSGRIYFSGSYLLKW